MKIEKIPKGILIDNTRKILGEKINELIDEINYWKKAHVQLQDQFIQCKIKSNK